jgi:hypothetical protein
MAFETITVQAFRYLLQLLFSPDLFHSFPQINRTLDHSSKRVSHHREIEIKPKWADQERESASGIRTQEEAFLRKEGTWSC